MTRILPLCLLAASTAVASAAHTYYLADLRTTDGQEGTSYTYNDQGLLVRSFNQIAITPEYNSISVYTRDAKGLIERMDLYQDYFMSMSDNIEDFRYNCYITYEYNDKEQLVKRRNFNNFNMNPGEPDFQPGGIMTYEYDKDGHLTFIRTYWDETLSKLAQEIRFEYNAKGQLTRRGDYMASTTSQSLTNNINIDYFYNEDGTLDYTQTFVWDDSNGRFIEQGKHQYEYDEAGNLTAIQFVTPTGTIQEKKQYFYNEPGKPADVDFIAWPIELEDAESTDFYNNLRNAPKTMEAWDVNLVSNSLQLYATYEYVYETYGGVQGVNADAAADMCLSAFTSDRIVLQGVPAGEIISFFDMEGRRVLTARQNPAGIDISALAAGQYCVATPCGAVKICK